MDKKVVVYVEIEKNSNEKYELNKETNKLELDRLLPYPYYYPYCYGFIEDTMATDNDELDALIITDEKVEKDQFYLVYIIGVLIMEDEKGLDEKVLCVLEKDFEHIKSLSDLPQEVLDNIQWFFTNYKNKTPNKWSIVRDYKDKNYAIELYEKYVLRSI